MHGIRQLVGLVLVLSLASCGGEDTDVSGSAPPAAPPASPVVPVLPVVSADAGPWILDPALGAVLFGEKCLHCHGVNATGGYGPSLQSAVTCPPCADFTMLWRRIDEFMPLRNPEACDAHCSRSIAAWISNGFSTLPSCSVEFRYDSVAAQRFAATIRITNFRGQDVPMWRLGFMLPANHALAATSNAVATVTGSQIEIRPLDTTPGISSGGVVEIGLQGTHAGLAVIPTDLRLEAPPCFTGV